MSYENPKYIDQNPGAFMEAFSTSFKEGQARLKEIEDRKKEREKEVIAYNERVGSILDPYSSENTSALAGINKSDEAGRTAIINSHKEFSALAQRIAKTGGSPEDRQKAIEMKQSLTNLNTAKSTFEATLQHNTELEKKGEFSNTPNNIRNRQIASDYARGKLMMQFDPEARSYVLKKEGSDEPPISLNNFIVNKDFLKYDSKVDHSKFESDISKVIESKGQNMLKNIDTTTDKGDKLRYLVIDPGQAINTLKKDDTFTSYIKANASDIFYNTLHHNTDEKLLSPTENGYDKQQEDIATAYATIVYSNNLSKPYASGAVTNVTQEAKDTRQKYLDAKKYGDNKPEKPTESEKNKEIRNIIYNNASALAGKAKVTELLKLKDVLSGWTRVAGKGNETKMQRKTSQGGVEIINTANMDAEALRSTFTTY